MRSAPQRAPGLKTTAVYDRSNDKDLAQIWNTADIYLPEFADFIIFWRRAMEMK